jgi:hypothetical protein
MVWTGKGGPFCATWKRRFLATSLGHLAPDSYKPPTRPSGAAWSLVAILDERFTQGYYRLETLPLVVFSSQ